MPKKPGLTLDEEEKIKTLIAMGKTYHAVALEIGRDAKTVKKYAIQSDTQVEIVEKKKELAEWFEGLAERMLESITDEDIGKISAYQRTLSAAVATDKMRLLRGNSTDNMELTFKTIWEIRQMEKRKEEMKLLPASSKEALCKTEV
jgi:hypothetical protein